MSIDIEWYLSNISWWFFLKDPLKTTDVHCEYFEKYRHRYLLIDLYWYLYIYLSHAAIFSQLSVWNHQNLLYNTAGCPRKDCRCPGRLECADQRRGGGCVIEQGSNMMMSKEIPSVKTNIEPVRRPFQKKNVFQPSFFPGYVFSGRVVFSFRFHAEHFTSHRIKL